MKVPWIEGLRFLEHLIHTILHGLQTFQWPKTDTRCWNMVRPIRSYFAMTLTFRKKECCLLFFVECLTQRKDFIFPKPLHMSSNATIPHADDMHVLCSRWNCCGSCTENSETFRTLPQSLSTWKYTCSNMEKLTRQQNSTEPVTCTQLQYLLQTVQQRVYEKFNHFSYFFVKIQPKFSKIFSKITAEKTPNRKGSPFIWNIVLHIRNICQHSIHLNYCSTYPNRIRIIAYTVVNHKKTLLQWKQCHLHMNRNFKWFDDSARGARCAFQSPQTIPKLQTME